MTRLIAVHGPDYWTLYYGRRRLGILVQPTVLQRLDLAPNTSDVLACARELDPSVPPDALVTYRRRLS